MDFISKKEFCFFIISLFFVSISYAQNDIILKVNGDEMIGKVIKMNTDDLLFTYQNETVEYRVEKKIFSKSLLLQGELNFLIKKKMGLSQN